MNQVKVQVMTPTSRFEVFLNPCESGTTAFVAQNFHSLFPVKETINMLEKDNRESYLKGRMT